MRISNQTSEMMLTKNTFSFPFFNFSICWLNEGQKPTFCWRSWASDEGRMSAPVDRETLWRTLKPSLLAKEKSQLPVLDMYHHGNSSGPQKIRRDSGDTTSDQKQCRSLGHNPANLLRQKLGFLTEYRLYRGQFSLNPLVFDRASIYHNRGILLVAVHGRMEDGFGTDHSPDHLEKVNQWQRIEIPQPLGCQSPQRPS